jgi:hypothetical protein
MRPCFELYKFVFKCHIGTRYAVEFKNLLSNHLKICNNNSSLVFTDVTAKISKVFLRFVKLIFKKL